MPVVVLSTLAFGGTQVWTEWDSLRQVALFEAIPVGFCAWSGGRILAGKNHLV